MRLGHLNMPGIDMTIYRDHDYYKLYYTDFFNHRLGDRVGQTAVVSHVRDNIQTIDAIMCVDYFYSDVRIHGTTIDIRKYFDHQYDAIVYISTREAKDAFATHCRSVFPNCECINRQLWETLPGLRRQGYYQTMHSCPEYDRWWEIERVRAGIPRRYLACHILTDSDYHPNKTINYTRMVEAISEIAIFIPVVIVGSHINPIVKGKNIWDLTPRALTIDNSIAIVNGCTAFLGGDTGITHVAAGLGKHVVQLFPGEERFHNEKYDARPAVPGYRYSRLFLNIDTTFDVNECIDLVLDTLDKLKG